ncbi:hypothetical protein FAZ69_22220 [Trinickia terrae]|uniref:CN hydrolase domain-containing protein n=1 Tax=Trinickia terrae TaxID=2571161 RepID=A0A4U1HWK6_9BURK|nr:hypothetical protein [Trinickia terrae]TKC86022.1 hypothetical protein FAZ69_22220 [Trinickia terrae]
MTQQTVVTIIEKNSFNDYTKKTIEQRIEIINDACSETERLIKNGNQNIDTSEIRAIIVAPEYFLSRKYDAIRDGDVLFTHRDIMIYAREEIAKISTRYKNMLIVPGSAGYIKEVDKRTEKGKLRVQKALERLAEEDTGNAEIEYPRGVTDHAEYKAYWESKLASPQTSLFVYSNCMFAFLNGSMWKHRKTLGFNENKDMPDEFLSIDRPSDSAVVNIAGRTFGFEICFEHNQGVLKKLLGKSAVDFHIVVSDYVEKDNSHISLKSDGYFIHASTRPSDCIVQDSKRKKISTTQIDGNLSLYVIDTPAPAAGFGEQQSNDTTIATFE